MSKVLIFTNHTMPASVGGCEVVVDRSASHICQHSNVIVFGCDVPNSCEYNGYKLEPWHEHVLAKIASLVESDCVFVYSDSFLHWARVLEYCSSSKCRVVLCTVGLHASRKSVDIMNRIRSLGNRIKIVVHSKLHDECSVLDSFGISYSVIPNGVDSGEFSVHKRSIPSKHKFITVANCYPGKGHEHVLSALNMLHADGLNFSWTVFCTTPHWHVAKRLTMMIMTACSKAPFETSFMLDRERSLLCSSMRSSTLMLHGSVSEVAPLVVLEAMASEVPWVAFDIGNVSELSGGLVAGPPPVSSGGNHVKRFAGAISDLVDKNSKIYEDCSSSGVNLVKSSFDWNSILPKYKEIFLGK